ncbi:MAG: hypothetical protein WDO74_07825 [Pseudomonadota bacterium]
MAKPGLLFDVLFGPFVIDLLRAGLATKLLDQLELSDEEFRRHTELNPASEG